MDKTVLYKKLDIDTIEDFKFYENLSALLEEDEYIEENLIKDLIKDVNIEVFAEHLDSFFDAFLKNIPDSETELYMVVDGAGRALTGMVYEDMTAEDIASLAEEIERFRKWYVHDLNVFDRANNEELSVRDARYNILAAGFLGESYDYDFRNALDYRIEGYDVMISDFVNVDDEVNEIIGDQDFGTVIDINNLQSDAYDDYEGDYGFDFDPDEKVDLSDLGYGPDGNRSNNN